ncbi:MAG: glutamine amidotransferase [Bifidobacteriaceae bacterium]|nr:glutamine amidotransferase [Bifidobacteriaceae bacterium]
MNNRFIKILHLYPKDMNIYGDHGNLLVLSKRAQWLGIQVQILDYNQGERFPTDFDLLIGGGGQDSGQSKVCFDLQRVAGSIKSAVDNGVPMLLVCGLYQLFGEFFKPIKGSTLPGIGVFPFSTVGQKTRMIGNVLARSREFGDLIGFENHSGNTVLDRSAVPLAHKILQGYGNNTDRLNEGCRIQNVVGTYLHGSMLPKNPQIADWMIGKVAQNRGWKLDFSNMQKPQHLDDWTNQARISAKSRPY